MDRTKRKKVIGICAVSGYMNDDSNFKGFLNAEKVDELRKVTKQKIDEILGYVNITKQQGEELARDIRDGIYSIDILNQTEKIDKRRQVRKEPVMVNRGDLEDLVCETLTICETCTRNTKRCNLRKSLKKLGVEEADPDKDGGCEFFYKR